MRKRAIALVFFGSTVWAQLAHGLGLGDIEVYSALNQALEAEITLTSVRPDEMDGLIVKLASEEAFDRAGVERPFYLTRLKFSLASKPDGTQFVKISTEDPVREPFLNFLIDVDWPRGRLVREYTVLLDPPVFASQQQTPAPQTVTSTADAMRESATGEPALIDRESMEEDSGDFDFGLEEGMEAAAGGFAGEESAVDATSLIAGIPDIEVEGGLADESAGSEELAASEPTVDPYGMGEEADLFPGSGGEMLAAEEEALEFEDEGLEAQSDTTSSEEEQLFVDTAGETEPLPDIDIVLDETLPYDEVATNALLAQFAAEDSVRDSAGWPSTVDGQVADQDSDSVGDEHDVKAGDTLYEIASQYKPVEVSVNQAMLAILRYNPNAFIRGNINDVKKGFVLRIPDKSAMLEMNNMEALEEVKRQTALWREYRSQLAGAASATRDAQSADSFQSRAASDSVTKGGELTILSPGRDAEADTRAAGQQEGADTESGSLRRDLQLAREQLAAERLEKIELQERLTELGGQLESMERLITLKNEQLAQLQQKMAVLEAQEKTGTEKPEAGDEPPVTTTDPASEKAADTQPSTTADPANDGNVGAETGDPAEIAEIDLGLTLEGKSSSPDSTPEEPLELDLLSGTEIETEAGAEQELETQTQIDQKDTEFGDVKLPDSLLDRNATAGDLQNQPGSESEDSSTESQPEQTGAVESPAIETPSPVERTGISGWVYEHLPSPYNLMAADALESRVGLAVLGGIGIVLLLIILSAVKPKNKSKTETKTKKKSKQPEPVSTQTVKTKVAKPPLGQRLKAMFAPLGGLFTSNKKSSLISIMSESASRRREEPDAHEGAADNTDDEDADSFEETVMVAAVAVKNDANKKGISQQSTKTASEALTSKALPEAEEPEEEVADDTTAEADVYLAYGLFDQAEELLTQALAGNPDKMEYKGKLLETYFAAGKKTEFEKLAAGIHGFLNGKPSRIWDKALVMGKEIAPDNSLFSGVTDTGLKISDFAPAKPETADLDLSGSQGKTTPDIEFGDDEDESSATDFDLDLGGDDSKFEETFINPSSQSDGNDSEKDLAFELNSKEVADELGVDFNADELGLGADLNISADQTGLNDDSGEDATVAIDLGFDLDDEAGVDLDMDLSDVDITGIEEDDLKSGLSASDDLLAELDSGDSQEASVNTEFEILDDDTIIDSELDDDTFGGGSNLDEVATKLDLAKAYMDMGDYDGASSTLEEVLAEGDDSQRQEAEELLDQIN